MDDSLLLINMEGWIDMPIQIMMPLNQLAKKFKSVFPEIGLIVHENDVDIIAFDPSNSMVLIIKNVGVNIGESSQNIIVDANDIGKIESLRIDFDIEEGGVLKAKYVTKNGVEIEKELIGRIDGISSEMAYELFGKSVNNMIILKAKELKEALDEIEVDDSDEILLRVDKNILVIHNESKISKKLMARIKLNDEVGNGFEIKLMGSFKRIVEGLSTISNILKIGRMDDGLIRIETEEYGIVIIMAPIT